MKKTSAWLALIPVSVLVILIVIGSVLFGDDLTAGPSQIALLVATVVGALIAMFRQKISWEKLEEGIADNFSKSGGVFFILLSIGALTSAWMLSGVVPTLIYYGLQMINPSIFLLVIFIFTALISLILGSSWTTIGTIGIAMLSAGEIMGFNSGWLAGAIISGAYFGDKVSPLSDTTVLASSSAGTPLFTHIRFMMVTTVPSFVISLVIFLIVSLIHKSPDAAVVADISHDLKSAFNISPWLLLVPVITALLIVKKVSAIVTLFIAAFIAGITALFFQPHIISAVANEGMMGTSSGLTFVEGFKGLFITYYGSTAIDTGNIALNELVATRGMTGMLATVFLIIAAGTFGGTLVGSGMLQSLTEMLTRFISRRVSMVASTVGTGVMANMVTGDQYLSIILTSSLYKDLYEKRGYESKLLSRSVEDSATVVSVLIPWNSCGMTQATVLKVPTIDYLPYCFFNILSPLMSVFVAAIGYKIKRISK